MSSTTTLHVLYSPPSVRIPHGDFVLCFLSPQEEEILPQEIRKRIIVGRREVDRHREAAERFYKELLPRFSATPCGGKTLRQSLAMEGASNPWWYHQVSCRAVEWDPTFNTILHVFAVDGVAKERHVSAIAFHGGGKDLAEAFKQKYRIEMHGISRPQKWLFRSVGSRFKKMLGELQNLHLLKKHLSLPKIKVDVAFQGFWDWSVSYDQKTGEMTDNYFRALPGLLKEAGREICWFAWFSPEGRSYRQIPAEQVARGARGVPGLVILQLFLTYMDIMKCYADFRPLIAYLAFRKNREFGELFIEDGVDYFPLIDTRLLAGFYDGSIPDAVLTERATRRAAAKYAPRLVIAFLEMFQFSRALYAGAGNGSPDSILCAMQHASYNREKCMYYIDPERDYAGRPDGIACPRPDYVFAMGELGKLLFEEAGFTKVILTGSARYDTPYAPVTRIPDEGLSILLMPTLFREQEIEMVQAAYFATEHMPGVRLLLRSHPAHRVEDMPEFKRYSDRVTPVGGDLRGNYAMADVVLFSYSTTAEEAIMCNVPVWQWLPAGFNGSAFREIGGVRAFASTVELRDAVGDALEHGILPVSASFREKVLRACFYKNDGGNARRITDECIRLMEGRREHMRSSGAHGGGE